MSKSLLLSLLVLLFIGCKNESADTPTEITNSIPAPANIAYTIIKIYPHDTSSYTQGLIWHNGKLYEGTGLEGKSNLMVVNLTNGIAEKKISLPNAEFGEGITLLNGKIYQLTYTDHKVYMYNSSTFKKEKEFEWPYEGWGLTNNGTHLIISTGGSNLYFVNPTTFKIERTMGVTDNLGYVDSINELEFVNGFIYANKYLTNYIYKINATTGLVEGKADLTNLLKDAGASYDPRTLDEGYVLNGIAYDSTKKVFFITGKNWPIMAEVGFN